jgi:hypothetical protein
MSNDIAQDATNGTADANGQPGEILDSPDTDWFLCTLVRLANEGTVFPVTLSVGAAVISGMLIGGKAYFEALGSAYSAGSSDPEVATMLKDFFNSFGSIYKSTPPGEKPPTTTYIHLKDAQFFYPDGKVIPANGLLWRGRLGAVDGFSVGSFRTIGPNG